MTEAFNHPLSNEKNPSSTTKTITMISRSIARKIVRQELTKTLLVCALLFSSAFDLFAQFDGAAGTAGSLAIHRDSSIILDWASGCSVTRGRETISANESPLASFGTADDAVGPANGVDAVSLGDSGIAILTFDAPIINGAGPDFAVFENSFSDNFLELAFVEVSSDGIHYVRFPATSNASTEEQWGPFSLSGDPTLIHNLAGKYRANFGTPFDLEELSDSVTVDINAITHVKIVDVIGSIDPLYGSLDQQGNLINDPFPTAFSSSGFDLDAVAVIHQQELGIENAKPSSIGIFPNPIVQGGEVHFRAPFPITHIQVIDAQGRTHFSGKTDNFSATELKKGVYFFQITDQRGTFIEKMAVH